MAADPRSLLPLPAHDLQILVSIRDRPLHGYALVGDIAERTGGEVTLGTSTLYAALKRLRAAGVVEETDPPAGERSDDERRRYYRTTTFGRTVLREEIRRIGRLNEMFARLRLAGRRRL